jgi:uncharacterized UBP type Zn finger protein
LKGTDTRLYGVSSLPSAPRGLPNLSNTCFLNAIVQALHTASSYESLVTKCSFSAGSVGHELKRLFADMKETGGTPNPTWLALALGIDIYVQQDAEETYLRILNAVDDSVEAGSFAEVPSKVFYIQSVQQIACTSVQFMKSKAQSSYDLPLDIEGHKTVNEALKQYFKPELLHGENRYRTEQFGLQEAVKSLSLLRHSRVQRLQRSQHCGHAGCKRDELPQVLALHLKRFTYDASTRSMSKVNRVVNIPTA